MRIFFMILIVVFCVSTAFCEVFYIPDDHPTISSAYQVISENDTICLRSGIHYDNVQIDSMDINIISESGSDSTRLCPLDPQQAIFYGTGTELIFLGDIAIKGIRFDSLSQTGIFDLAGESEPPFSEVLIDSCAFHENSVDPIIKIQHRNITIKDCLFSNNHSNLIEFINFYETDTINIEGNDFINNQGTNLIKLSNNPCNVNNNTFQSNTADTICYIEWSRPAVIDSNQWLNNIASKTLCILSSTYDLSISHNTFSENNGGISCYANHVGGLIRNNLFDANSGGSALGIETDVLGLIIDSNQFVNNIGANKGGGIYMDCNSTDVIIRDNYFYNNNAQFGAGLYLNTGAIGSSQYIEDNVIVKNYADSSYILHFAGSGGYAKNNLIDSNYVESGSIIFCTTAGPNSAPSISQNTLLNNTVNDGFAIIWLGYARHGSGRIDYNLLYDNNFTSSSGYAIASTDPSFYTLINNLVVNNGNCTGIYGNPDSEFGGDNNISCNNSWGNDLGAYEGFDPDSTNISLDPMFCNPDSGDFTVANYSPCLPENNICGELIGVYGYGCEFAEIIDFQIESEASMTHIINHSPVFLWNHEGYQGFLQTHFEIAVGTDDDWQYAEMWNPAPVMSADTFVQYNGSPLGDGETYYLRIRIGDDQYWTDWYETSFRMNSVPTIPELIFPTDSAFTELLPTLCLENAIDAELDSLCYTFQIWADTEELVAEVLCVPEQEDSTSWQSDIELIENRQHWWRAKASDYYEESEWSEMETFFVNSVNSPPLEFSLIMPPDTNNTPLVDLTPIFVWEKSIDVDPFDSIEYSLMISLDSNFQFSDEISGISDNEYKLNYNLSRSEQYWWKVLAQDRYAGETWSSNVLDFWTMICGDTNDDKAVGISDAVYVINYVFLGGLPPNPIVSGDANCDGLCDISDAFYLINYIFQDGKSPCDPDGDDEPDC